MARRPPLSPSGEALVSVLRSEKEQGFSLRTIAERFGFKSESTVRDYLSGRRQPSAVAAERAIHRYVEAQSTPRLILTREHGLVAAEPLDRRAWSTLGRFDHALGEARRTGDWSLVGKALGRRDTIRTTIGTVRLETRPEKLEEADNAGVYTGRDQTYRSPKKSRKPRARRRAA